MTEPRQTIDILAMKKELSEPAPDADSVLIERDHPVEVRYTDPATGKLRSCTCISHVPDKDGRTLIARMEATMAGVAWATLPPVQQGRFHALSTVAVQLNDPPTWLIEACGEDDDLLVSLLGVLESHADRYFRGDREKGDLRAKGRVLAVRLVGTGTAGATG